MKTETIIATRIYSDEMNDLYVEITAPNCTPVINNVPENTNSAAIEMLAGMLAVYTPAVRLSPESNIAD